MQKEQIKFILGTLATLPLMPIVYLQAKRVKKAFPSLPEAKNPHGQSGLDFTPSMSVVGLGESTMAGVGIDSHSNGFIGQFCQALAVLLAKKIDWKVYAKSGFTAKMTKELLLPQIMESKVDLFIIALGGNDTFQRNSPNQWAIDIRLLIEALRKKFPETPILFTTVPPVHTFPAFTSGMRLVLGGLIRLHSAVLEKLVQDFDQVYYDPRKINLNDWLKRLPDTRKEDFYADGVHPSPLTFKIWGQEMAELIYHSHFSSSGNFV